MLPSLVLNPGAQAIHLPQPQKYWDYRQEPLHPATMFFFTSTLLLKLFLQCRMYFTYLRLSHSTLGFGLDILSERLIFSFFSAPIQFYTLCHCIRILGEDLESKSDVASTYNRAWHIEVFSKYLLN